VAYDAPKYPCRACDAPAGQPCKDDCPFAQPWLKGSDDDPKQAA
jgi:hypothetical protein